MSAKRVHKSQKMDALRAYAHALNTSYKHVQNFLIFDRIKRRMVGRVHNSWNFEHVRPSNDALPDPF
jgi:hypothetical protein